MNFNALTSQSTGLRVTSWQHSPQY